MGGKTVSKKLTLDFGKYLKYHPGIGQSGACPVAVSGGGAETSFADSRCILDCCGPSWIGVDRQLEQEDYDHL